MLTAHEDDKVRVFDMGTGRIVNQFVAHGDAVTSVVTNHNGNSIFTVSHDGHIKVWDLRKTQCLADHEVIVPFSSVRSTFLSTTNAFMT